MQTLLNAESVLVLGVSNSPRNMGRNIVDNLVTHRFGGETYLYGAKGGAYAGHRIHNSLEDVPDGLDLAVFLVPARAVPDLLEQCGKKGIRRAVIETGGFSELGDVGLALEQQIIDVADRYDMRFLGPNCLGFMNVHNGLAVPFMSLPRNFGKGDVALLAQSGGVGIVYLTSFAEANVGLSAFVSLGNKINVNEVDLLKYFNQDPKTSVACLYLEDVKRGREFYQEARDFDGPVIVQKANTTALGSRIAQTHTASIAVDDAVFDGMCRQANIVRVPDMKNMLNGAMALSLPLMKGRRLGIVARSGGHAVIAADLADDFGFELPPLPAHVAEVLRSHTRAGVIRPINPLDLGDLFDFDVYVELTRQMVESGEYDAIAFIHVFSSVDEHEASLRMARAFHGFSTKSGIPVAICFMSDAVGVANLRREASIPVFPSPEETIRALGLSRDYYCRQLRKQKETPLRPLSVDELEAARGILARCSGEGHEPTSVEAFEVLAAVGIPVAPWRVASTPEEAGEAARELGGAVVLKLLSRDISHKSDIGGVVIGLHSAEATRDEAIRMNERVHEELPAARLEGFLVQQVVRGIREALVGVRQDETFGPVVVAGFGGIYTELFKDISIRLAPISDEDAKDLIDEVVFFKALRPWRGHPASDTAFLKDVIARLAHLVSEAPELLEFEINPVRVLKKGKGGVALDARMVVG